MSSAPTTPIANSPVKKTKSVSLPEKFHKFIQFGYYMMSQMSDAETFTKEEFINNLKMFATVDEQQTFIQNFFDNQKSIKSSIRKDIQDRNKANKPKKVRAPRKTNKSEPNVEPTTQEAANNNQENLIESLTDELTEEPMIDKINAAIEIAEDMTAKKPREKKASTGEKKAAAAVTDEKKQRVVKKKNTKEPTTENTPTLNSH